MLRYTHHMHRPASVCLCEQNNSAQNLTNMKEFAKTNFLLQLFMDV